MHQNLHEEPLDYIHELPLDVFSNRPIIGRNIYSQMNIFSLSLIVVLLAVLIIKDLFVVRMATVKVKK